MGRTAQEYQSLLQSLFPKGVVWNRSKTSVMGKLMLAFGEEFSRIEDRQENLFNESITTRTIELIPEYEEEYALPEFGEELAPSNELRRQDIHSKKIEVGEQNKEYFIEIAEALGYTISIEEYTPFWAGYGAAGDTCGDQNMLFNWTVLVDVVLGMRININNLINRITSLRPGHTHLFFRFNGVGFSNGFSRGFTAIPWYDGTIFPGGFAPGFSTGFAVNNAYDGTWLVGGFSNGFSEGFRSYSGGGFNHDGFSTGFSKPS